MVLYKCAQRGCHGWPATIASSDGWIQIVLGITSHLPVCPFQQCLSWTLVTFYFYLFSLQVGVFVLSNSTLCSASACLPGPLGFGYAPGAYNRKAFLATFKMRNFSWILWWDARLWRNVRAQSRPLQVRRTPTRCCSLPTLFTTAGAIPSPDGWGTLKGEVTSDLCQGQTASSLNCPNFNEVHQCKWGNTNDEELDWISVSKAPQADQWFSSLGTHTYPGILLFLLT